MRIVSLLPSATDIVVALGATRDLVGVSHSCGPQWAHLPRLTSTWIDTGRCAAVIDAQVRDATRPLYELDIDTLAALEPDVIVSQSLCKVCAIPSGDVLGALEALPRVPDLIDLSPTRLADVPRGFELVAAAIARSDQGRRLQRQWQDQFASYHQRYRRSGLKIAFLDWLDPPFAAGHWVPDMIAWLGLRSVLAQPGEPSYETSWEAIAAQKPDMVVAACCGFDKERAADSLPEMAPTFIECPVVLLDGYREFSRPSPALLDSMRTLNQVVAEYLGD